MKDDLIYNKLFYNIKIQKERALKREQAATQVEELSGEEEEEEEEL